MSLRMKNLLVLAVMIFVIIVTGFIAAHAQLPAGYVEITPLNGAASNFGAGYVGRAACLFREDGIYDEEKLRKLRDNPRCADEVKALNVDLSKHTLISYSARSDCHMRLRVKAFRSDTEKKYLVILNNIYGGCRAGGSREGWLILDKMPEGFTLEMKEVKVDRLHEPDGGSRGEFVFPKQPSGMAPELLESREVDVQGCLPLDRQSQWILIKQEFLDKALEDKSPRCRQLFKTLAIDFDKYTLAGYNVNTGDCYRPATLTQKLYKDFDQKRYRMEISYPENYGACHVVRYFPIWVLAPKLPADYGFQFEEKEIERETKQN